MKNTEAVTNTADNERATSRSVFRWFLHVSVTVVVVYTLFVGARGAVELWSAGKENAAIWMALLVTAGASAVLLEVGEWLVLVGRDQRIILLAVLVGVIWVVMHLLGAA